MGFEYCSAAQYAKCIPDWDDDMCYRMIIHDLPRYFHGATPETRKWMISERPQLTERRWDALLAATTEHIAILHSMAVPDWVDEEERFLDPPWFVGMEGQNPFPWLATSPPPFHRHGTIINPGSLDERGGQRWYAAVIGR